METFISWAGSTAVVCLFPIYALVAFLNGPDPCGLRECMGIKLGGNGEPLAPMLYPYMLIAGIIQAGLWIMWYPIIAGMLYFGALTHIPAVEHLSSQTKGMLLIITPIVCMVAVPLVVKPIMRKLDDLLGLENGFMGMYWAINTALAVYGAIKTVEAGKKIVHAIKDPGK